MGDWEFINDHMGGFDSESGLPNFMKESASKSYSRPTKVSAEENKKILEEMLPISESRELNDGDYSGLIKHGMGKLFLFHKKITQKEFDEMSLKASKWQFTKEEYVEILNRFTEEEYVEIFKCSKKNTHWFKPSS
ncbi:hypothetical protein OAE45_05385 [Candidatus Thioglobus sp.]|nr:hypothetical protein [Candidatus Thioglobus sp.]